MKPRAPSAVSCAALSLVGLLAACPPPEPEPEQNQPPVARLVLPQLWPTGEPAAFDPTFSEDPEGGALRFAMVFGDGTPDAEGAAILEHVYAAPGSFAVELTAIDEIGLTARVQAQLVVVDDEVELCSCELACMEDAICADQVCTLFRSSLDEDVAPTLDDQLTCP